VTEDGRSLLHSILLFPPVLLLTIVGMLVMACRGDLVCLWRDIIDQYRSTR